MEITRLVLLLFWQVHDGLLIFGIIKVVLNERSWSLYLVFHLIKNEVVSFFIFIISSALLPCPWLIGNTIVVVGGGVVVVDHIVSNNFPSIDNGGHLYLTMTLEVTRWWYIPPRAQ
jgi:hypothetical protein